MGTITAYNVKDYGAVGNGSTDDSSAIRDCIQAALVGADANEGYPSERPTIYFPEGVYMIFDDGLLSDWGNTDLRNLGMKFVGAGMGATSLKLKTTSPGTARWFWNNRAESYKRKLMHGVFQDLMFESDQDFSQTGLTPLANGFKIWSNGYEKQWRFVNCSFRNLAEAVRTDGSGNADQIKFFGCDFRAIKDAVLVTYNSQSVAHTFFGCDIQCYGDVIKVDGKEGAISGISSSSADYEVTTAAAHGLTSGDYVQLFNAGAATGNHFITVTGSTTFTLNGTSPGGTLSGIPAARFNIGGGGSISMVGGSVVLSQDPDNSSRAKYILNSSGLDAGGDDFSFSNLKVEMSGSATGCCRLGHGTINHFFRTATFRDCNFRTTSGSTRDAVKLDVNQVVTFDNCLIPNEWNFRWETTSGGNLATPSLITLQNCLLDHDLYSTLKDRINIAAGSWGRLITRNCRGLNFSGTTGRYSLDHDYNWKNAGQVDVPVQRTTAVLATTVEAFPRSTNQNERTIVLPENAMLIAVHAYKPAVVGGPTDSYVLKIGNNDYSTVYASSDNAAHLKRQPNGSAGTVTTQYKDAHEVHVTDIWKDLGTSLTDRTIRMWATHTSGSTADQTGGYALVEYI